MIKIGILGAAGYTGGELIRLLLNHPEAHIVFANSESNTGKRVDEVHEGLIGDTDLRFTAEMPFDQIDVLFFCFGHGKSEAFLREHPIPAEVKIIDLAQDFRLNNGKERGNTFVSPFGSYHFIYGLPEIHREAIRKAHYIANPGCFATCIQLGLLPLAKAKLLQQDVAVNAITGATGAGQKPSATTHFSWRDNNLSIYKVFTHQHLHEIRQSLIELQGSLEASIDFIPYRGNFSRGIFCTEMVRFNGEEGSVSNPTGEQLAALYKTFYRDAPFTHYADRPLDLKQVVNTNKALIHIDKFENKAVITCIIDNLLKGAVGQAVQNMNLICGLDETCGLQLKASAF